MSRDELTNRHKNKTPASTVRLGVKTISSLDSAEGLAISPLSVESRKQVNMGSIMIFRALIKGKEKARHVLRI